MTAETTQRQTSVFSEVSPKVPAERYEPAEAFSLRSSAATLRDRIQGVTGWLRGWIVPPNVLVEPPAAFSELTSYAYRGGWTASTDGPLRKLAALWLLVVALPAIFCLRLAEWLIQRPSRAIFVTVVWQLVIRTDGPGPWLSQYILRPFWSVLGWIFLS